MKIAGKEQEKGDRSDKAIEINNTNGGEGNGWGERSCSAKKRQRRRW